MENKNNKDKNATIRAILKNPKMSGMLRDAWNAPMGSTKRDNVKSIVSMLTKISGINEMPVKPKNKKKENKKVESKKIIFPSVRINDGKGGCNKMHDGKGGGFDFNAWRANPSSTQKIEIKNPYAEGVKGTPTPKYTGIKSGIEIGEPTGFKMPEFDVSKIKKEKPLTFTGTTPPKSGINVKERGAGVTTAKDFKLPSGYSLKKPTTQEEKKEEVKEEIQGPSTQEPTEDVTYGPAQFSEMIETITSSDATPTEETTVGDSTNLLDKIEGYENIGKIMSEGIESGLGADATVARIMADKEALKELFPGVPEEDIPVGASLTAQVADLRDSLKQEYGLDSLLDKIEQTREKGLTFQDDLESYIRGRDEYMNKIDGMIGDFKRKMTDMDLANPEIANSAKQYMTYLTTLKGRQNQRYIDFVDTSIDQYNAEVDSLNNQYQSLSKDFLEEFNTLAAINQEDYNRLYGTLTNMYNSLAQGTSLSLEDQKLQAEIDKIRTETMLDVMDNVESSDKSKYIKNYPKYLNIISTDTEGENLAGDISQMINLADSQEDMEGAGVIYSLSKTMADNLNKSISGDIEQSPYDLFDDYYNMVSNYAQSGEAGSEIYAPQLASGLIMNMEPVLTDDIKNNISGIKDAVSDLVGEGWFNSPKTQEEIEEWKEEYSDQVPPQLLDYIQRYYFINSQGLEKPKEVFTYVMDPNTGEYSDKGKISNVGDVELLEKIVPGIMELWTADMTSSLL